ncbi:MAG: hypothetical protein K2Y16_10360 [Burkholderiales bacterium]|nr:hypothetical protein [Burkholderiales bacterium]
MNANSKFKTFWPAAVVTCGVIALLLTLPLALFTLFSWIKLGFVNFSYYVPHEEFWQSLASGNPQKIYTAPLVAINVTSGFLIANMFTYTLGHTLVSVILAVLVVWHVALAMRRARRCGVARMPTASIGGATAGVFAATAASSSAALTGCCGAGMAGGIVALAGFGSATGAWMSNVATWTQFALVLLLALGLIAIKHKNGRPA